MKAETSGWNRVMQIQFAEEGERLIARPQGRMEAADGRDFAAAVQQRLHAGTKSLTIDLERLEFLNFGGIRAILKLARSLKDSQTDLDFLAGRDTVRDALDQAGLDDFFPFTPPYEPKRGRPR